MKLKYLLFAFPVLTLQVQADSCFCTETFHRYWKDANQSSPAEASEDKEELKTVVD